MTSQLASQLQKLQTRPEGDKHLNESFLFSKGDARSFSREQIHQLATNGLQTLMTLDNRFHPFIHDLFDPQKTRQERKLLHAEESRRLDMKLEHLLTLLSPHLFLTAAQQVFEYLVRVHEVHVYNVSAVLRAFLPYHDHNIFSRAILLLDLRDTGFDFLSKNQERGAPLLREHLVLACAESRKALRTVCMTAAMPYRLGVLNSAANALFASVATSLARHTDAEALWRVLLPFVVEFLQGAEAVVKADDATELAGEQPQWWSEGTATATSHGADREVVCTALLVLAAWSAEATFSLQMMRTVMRPIVGLLRNPSGSAGVPLGDLLTLVDLLFSSQLSVVSQVGFAPLLHTLVAAPWAQWSATLSESLFLEADRAGVTPLPSLLSALTDVALGRLRMAHSLTSVPAEVLGFLRCAAEQLPLTDSLVMRFLEVVMECEAVLASTAGEEGVEVNKKGKKTATAASKEGPSTFFEHIVAGLERRYQRVFDTTLSRALSGETTAEAAKSFLARHLGGTRYQMLEVSTHGGAGKERLPLFACLLHTVPEVRKAAAASMEAMGLAQLCATSAVGETGGSILELLAHAAQYESDSGVAGQFLKTGAAALRQLSTAVSSSETSTATGRNEEEEAEEAREGPAKDAKERQFHLAAVSGLLRALYTMVTALSAELQQIFFETILQPLSAAPAVGPATVKRAAKGGKKAKGNKATVEPEKDAGVESSVRAHALYYTTLLYVRAASTASGEAASTANEEEEEGSALAVTPLVRAMTNALLKEFPEIPKTGAVLKASAAVTGDASHQRKGTGRHQSDSSSSSDDDEDNDTAADRQTHKTSAATSDKKEPSFLAVLEHAPLLQGISAVAETRLRAALQTSLALLDDDASSPVQRRRTHVECAVAAAATLLAAPAQQHSLLQFLLGHGEGATVEQGYLHQLQKRERALARQGAAHGHGAGTAAPVVGRGAKNSLLNSAYLPGDGLTACLAAAVEGVVRVTLAEGSMTGTELVPLLRLLGFLGARLPTLSESPVALPAALLTLVDAPTTALTVSGTNGSEEVEGAPRPEDEGAFGVDWYALVHAAVYGPAEQRVAEAKASTGTLSLGALAACLFLPLRAPSSHRVKALQQLQDAILRGMTGKPAASGASCVHLVVATALAATRTTKANTDASLPPMDVTALSSVVEAMAKEESRFSITEGGAALVCALLAAAQKEGQVAPVVPYNLAADVVELFFAPPDVAGGKKASLDLATLWPQLERLITAAAGPRPAASSGGKSRAPVVAADSDVSVAGARYVEAVCRRVTLQPTAGPVASDPAVQLCLLLLRRPFLRVAGTASVRPVYRAALSALATALQHGVEAATQSSLIFRKGGSETGAGKKNGKGSSSSADAQKFAEALADIFRPLVVEATGTIGSDVARLCVGTVGGFQRLFRPFLANCSSAAVSSAAAAASTGLLATDGEALVSFLEVLAPESSSSAAATAALSGGRWLPQSDCVLSNPLTFADASTIVAIAKPSAEGIASSGKSSKGKGGKAAAQAAQDTWPRDPSSLMCLRVLSALLKAAPAVQFDDDEDAESLLALAMSILSTHPLDKMLPLLLPSSDSSEEATLTLATADGGSGSLLDVYPRHVLAFLRALTALCTEQPRALAEKDPRGAYKLRGAVLKQALVLMASLLLQSNDEDADGAAAAADISRGKVDVIAELLRTLAPLLGPLQDGLPTGKTEKAAPSFLLHIPIAALLVRLSAVEFSEALRYRSAADTCREIITSFDVHTQISTVTQLMRLVVDPHAVLVVASENEAEGNGQDEETEDAREVLHLFRKMVKPNQIVNRQEQLLDVITTTVKSDAFLTPFIQLQHHSGKKAGSGKQKTGEEEAAEEEEHDEATAAQHGAEGTNASDACMHLLLSALEMFSHYSDLNTATENDAEDSSAAAKDSGALYGENKSYAMLLELLAGNALACVLAGINEPTFVECQQRLLGDSRSTLQLKGLEVLLDRLHHSLPTVENTLSDEELEQHRRDLRDPKKKLTLADLVRVKARPLTTKRSFQLMPHLMTLLQAAQAGALSTTRKAAQSYTAPAIPMPALVQLFRIVQLSVAAVEELIRIVASGGSTQAEKTLLNTNRGRRVTEAQLSKLFGNKARVQQVHDFVKYVFELGMPSLSQGLQTLLRSARRSTFDAAGSSGESDQTMYAFKATAEEGIIAAMCGLLTALGTVAQVMGAAFSSTHCIALLNTTVSAVVFQVADLPAVVTRGEAGSLLRHTSLSCLIRVFPLCWQLSQPYLPRIIYAASHSTNVDDPETSYLCAEVLAVLEALMEPQLFLDATAECLRGMRHVNTAVLPGGAAPMDATTTGAKNARVVRVQATTHSFVLLFGCIARRVQSLRKEELLMMSVMTEGTTPQDNFWLAALQSLAGTANAAPSAEVVLPVLDAYTVFFLKFKPKHCTKFLRVIAEWAFGGDANHFSKSLKKGSSASKRANSSNTSSDNDEEEHGGTGVQGNADSIPRTSLHGWGLFYALYNHLLEKLGGILDFSFPTVLPYVVGTLNGYCSSAKDGGAKQLASLVALVLEGALDSVRRMSLAQTPGPDYDYSIPLEVFFATDEVFPGLMGALTHQLSNVAYLADELHDYRYRAEHMVIPAIRAFFACLNASKLQSKTQAELVRALRHPSRHVRRMALLCLDGVYADGGEELASRLMAEMLPSVVELTEDRDDAVVEEARKLCTNLSHMTGQDVLHAMS